LKSCCQLILDVRTSAHLRHFVTALGAATMSTRLG